MLNLIIYHARLFSTFIYNEKQLIKAKIYVSYLLPQNNQTRYPSY